MIKNSANLDATIVKPFAWASVAWLSIGAAVALTLSSRDTAPSTLSWMLALWLLSVLDLAATGKLVGSFLGAAVSGAENSEKTPAYAIQTFVWGVLKLACLGIFGLVLMRGRMIPTPGLLLGLGTLVVVPLVGGFIWSQRELSHA